MVICLTAVSRTTRLPITSTTCICRAYSTELNRTKKGKGNPYSITERRVPELIPVLDSQPAGDVSRKPDGRLPLLSARPAVTPLRGLLPILLLGE